ncbi:MAG: Bifunctional purine biosynthetic protein ade1 [Alyxoria varia]|nr:MAG: Bifunctional purine biosynthetic protein ade1 [Alyxoria varia]
MATTALTSTPLRQHPRLKLLASGKVREVYALDDERLLFVTTDRISAFDRVMSNGVPRKGELLTRLSCWWFDFFSREMPELRTHFLAMGLPDSLKDGMSHHDIEVLDCRTMVTKRLKVFKIEAVVRGYITGSAYASYKKDGTVNGKHLPAGLQESSRLDPPLYTPSTKADAGEHDENISEEEAGQIVGAEHAEKIKSLSLEVYGKAAAYAASRGIILADTKFEFGLDESISPPSVVIIDEILTPDSSRFWDATLYESGRSQASFDKQHLRDWLVDTGKKGEEGIEMTQDVIENTRNRYHDAYRMLTGEEL